MKSPITSDYATNFGKWAQNKIYCKIPRTHFVDQVLLTLTPGNMKSTQKISCSVNSGINLSSAPPADALLHINRFHANGFLTGSHIIKKVCLSN